MAGEIVRVTCFKGEIQQCIRRECRSSSGAPSIVCWINKTDRVWSPHLGRKFYSWCECYYCYTQIKVCHVPCHSLGRRLSYRSLDRR